MIPDEVLARYGWQGARITPITIGLINVTHRVDDGGARFVLQRLHRIFDAQVNDDIDAITTRIAARGMTTPRLHPTRDGARYVRSDDGVWRALTFVDGRCTAELRDPRLAEAAGALVARFHAALAGFSHEFAFTRAGVHDTKLHLTRLADAIDAPQQTPDDEGLIDEAREVADEILDASRAMTTAPLASDRIIHGDLKVSNLLFHADRDEGLALIDLDTMAHGDLRTEMGDALRSWCNPKGEDDARGALDEELFVGALRGYLAGSRHAGIELDRATLETFVDGVELISLELASRFCRDVFEDQYFGWNATKYPSRRAHNLVRARSQLALSRSVTSLRPTLLARVRGILDAR